jgi:hypothetical protein
MNVDDFIFANGSAIFAGKNILKVVKLTNNKRLVYAAQVSYPIKSGYFESTIDRYFGYPEANRHTVERPKAITDLKELAKFLEANNIYKTYKEEFSNFLQQLLVEKFGELPAAAVEDLPQPQEELELVSDADLLNISKPKVENSNQVLSFIRINR